MRKSDLAVRERTIVPARPERSRMVRLTAGVLGLLAVLLSALGSWIPSLWGDEVTSVLSSQRSFSSLFSMLGNVDAVHGTYYVLLHFWVDVFGPSAFSVRFPSAIAVGFMVAGVVILTTRLSDARTGVYAGVLALALPRVTYMGEEARGYALSAACVVWVTILLVHILQRGTPKRRLWIFYAFSLALCAYIFLFSLLILLAHAAVVFTHRDRSVRARWLRAIGGAVVLAGPVIGYGVGERGQIAFLADRDAANLKIMIVGQWFGNSLMATLAWLAVVASLVLAIVAWQRRTRADRNRLLTASSPNIVLLSAVWSLGSMLVLVGVNAIHPVYSSRYLSFAAPGVAILIAWLLGRLALATGRNANSGGRNATTAGLPWSRWLSLLLLGVFVAGSVPSYLADRTPYTKNNSDWAEVSAVIKAQSAPGDGILFDEGTRPSRAPRLAMHAYPDSYIGLTDIALNQPYDQTTNWHDSVFPLADVTSRLDGIDRVWLVEYMIPGSKASTYNLRLLSDLGYTVSRSWPLHSDVVLELTR